MCGRFALGIPRPQIIRAVHDEHPDLEVDLDEWIDEDAFQPRFNVAPRTRNPVIRRRNRFDDHVGAGETSESEMRGTVMHTMKWGLVPHWSKHEDTSLNTINAKGENLTDGGGMWTSIKGKKRCAVVCQGYYEWLKKGKNRIPHFTKHKDGTLMLLAGLYDSVILEGSTEPLWTFTIVTTDANKQLAWLHDRMPVVLGSSALLAAWLDTSPQTWTPKVARVVRPFISPDKKHDLECYAVPMDVGKVSAESATFVEPVSKRKDGIEAMFAKQSKGEAAGATSSSSSSPDKRVLSSDSGIHVSSKRRRDSPDRVAKDQRESSVELLSTDEPPSPKKARTKTQVVKPTSTSSNKKSSLEASSNPSPKAQNKSSKGSDQASPGSSKITNFFSKTEDFTASVSYNS